MVTHEITLSFTVTPVRVRLCLLLALCTLLPGICNSVDDISSFDIYYPPPVAAVDQLQVSGSVILARDYGTVYLGAANAGETADRPGAFVSLGTNIPSEQLPNPKFPAARLYVKGTMTVDGCISMASGGNSVGANTWRCKFKSTDP